MTVTVVTGTGTEVGKTVVTAAVAALAAAAGKRVAVVKPAQTGDDSDVQAVARLTGLADVHELARYPDPLAPATAARRAGVTPLDVAAMTDRIRSLAGRDLILVEGAGGLLVRLDAAGSTIADLAAALGAGLLVVTAVGLGTLNATALTCEAIAARGLVATGVVIGSWPARPDLAARANLSDLPAYTGRPLLGALPESIGRGAPREFLAQARRSLAPELGGTWTPPANGQAAAAARAHTDRARRA